MSARLSATGSASNPLAFTQQNRFNSNNNNNNNTTSTNNNDKTQASSGTPPTFHKKPSIRHDQEGKRLFFECVIEAEPQPVVQWFHNGQPLQPHPRYKFNIDKDVGRSYKVSLEVRDVSLDLAGSYQVECRNSLGESSAKISLNFDSEPRRADDSESSGKPWFLEKPVIKQSSDFKHVQFDCLIAADPKPTIQWLHQGQPLSGTMGGKIETSLVPVHHQTTTSSSSASASSSSSSSSSAAAAAASSSLGASTAVTSSNKSTYVATLVLKTVEAEQNGEYKCVASNDKGSSFASINLNILTNSKNRSANGRSPRFPRKPAIRQEGPVLKIECVVEASPKPTITWYHDQVTIIREDSRHSHCSWALRGPVTGASELAALGVLEEDAAFPATDGVRRLSSSSSRRSSSAAGGGEPKREVYVVTMEIKRPKATDGGIYRCNAVNEFGESSANIALNFQKSEEQQSSQLDEQQQVAGSEEVQSRTSRSRLSERAAAGGSSQQQQQQQESHRDSRLTEASLDMGRHSRQEQVAPAEAGELTPAARRTSSIKSLGGSVRQPRDRAGLEGANAYGALSDSRRTSSASNAGSVASSARPSVDLSQAMEVDVGAESAATSTNRISGGAAQRGELERQEAMALDQLAPAKRTSSTSSVKRSSSVKKKRPSLVVPGSDEGAPESGEPAGPVKRLVKKRVSVKRDASGLKDIAEHPSDRGSQGEALSGELRRDSAAGNRSATGTGASASRASVLQEGGSSSSSRRDRIPSVSVEAPTVLIEHESEPAAAAAAATGSAPGRASRRSSAHRGSTSDQESSAAAKRPSIEESQPEGGPKPDSKRRGTYDGLRGEPLGADDSQAEEEKRRYLATRGGASPRESLSPQQQQAGGLLDPRYQRESSPGSGSVSPRAGSAEPGGRRGSILLLPGEANDARRLSIIVPDDNRLRPGEIADRRRRSSIDVRRASAVEVEAADKPSTPLRACGKKPAIIDFQDNISGTENHTSYLTFGVEGDPVPTLRFYKGDSEIYEGGRYSIVTDGATNTVHFCIRKSKPMDEAKYKVTATNEHGEDAAYMQLFVSDESGMDFRAMLKHRQYAKWKKDQDDPNWGNLKSVEEERLAQIKEPKRPDNFLKPLQNKKVKQGKDLKVRFECVFSKSGVKAKWFRNNREIFPNNKFHLNSTGDLHVLEIDGPYVEDAGKFTCQCLDTKCSAMLEVEEPDPVYKFTKVLAKGYGQHLNRELVLECTCNSHRAQVEWYKDGVDGVPLKSLGRDDKYSFEMDKFGKKILRVKGCQFEDSGQYTCRIMNTPREDETTSTQVVISEKKFQIMKPLYSQRATEDDKVVLECEVDEYDAPVRWFRKDRDTGNWKELKQEQMKHKEIVVEGKKRRLVIKKAKCNDEGEYKCCTNADETSCELFVEPSNKWRKKLIDVTVVEDEPLVLEVELMERKPGVAIVWNRNGKQVGAQGGSMQTTADERINFRSNDEKQQLVIERARLTDAGDWSAIFNRMKCSCKVTVLPAEKAPTMRFPSTTVSADVGKSHLVEIPYAVQGTKQSPVVPQLFCNGQPVPRDKVELLVKDDKIIMKFKDPQRQDANDNYEFVLENSKGKQAQKFKLDVHGPPGTPQGPLKVLDVFKDRCKLKWERPIDNGGCSIAHYLVEKQEVGSGRGVWSECGITSTTELDVRDLVPKKEYKFRVRAVNKKGKSEALMTGTTTVAKDPFDPPSEPENLVVVNWDKDFVDLEWEAPMKDGGIPVETYIVESKSKFATDWLPIKEQPAGQGCKAHITETLKEGAQLQFRVRAANKMGQGEPSKATKPITIKARFVRPYIAGDGLKNIVVKKGRPIRYEINFGAEPPPEITWIANDQELKSITDKCDIDRADKKTILQVTNTTRADSGRYKLILKNSCGQVVSEADVVVLDRPSPPEGPLIVEELRTDQVTIKWRKPRDTGGQNIEGYVVEKMNLETGRWVPAGECGPGEETFVVKNLMKGKKYKFRVRAKNKEGESEALETSNVLQVGEEPTIQKCPASVTVGQGETAKVKVHFAGEPTEFRVINMDTGQEVKEAQQSGPGKPKYTVFDDYLTVTIPDAHKNKDAGRYKVELKNKMGSAEANFTLDVTGVPQAPTGPLEIGEVTENAVTLSWRPPSDDGGSKVNNYVVERRDVSQGEDAWIEVTAHCKDTNYTVQGLTKGHKYEFRVMAANDNGQSKPLLSESPVVAKLPYDPPSAPGTPEATPLSADSVLLEWAKPKSDGGSRITNYLIEKREPGSDTWQKVNPNQVCTGNQFEVKNLIENRKYEFRVVAQNAAGLSEPSECSAELVVKDPNASDVPRFLTGLKRTVGVENGTIELECVVQGHPPPECVWSKGSKPLRDGGKYCMTQESGPDGTTIHRLLISRASGDDADEYSLKATNKAGSRTTRCDVEIQTKPKITIPPHLNSSDDSSIGFERSENIQLKIPFTGNPAPEVHWFKGDEEIEPGAQFDIETDGRHTTLTIRDASREDSGQYRLVVENKLGKDAASFNVSVSDRPEPPRFPQLETSAGDEGDERVTISWKAPQWDGGSQVTQYVVEKRELPMSSWIRCGTTRFLQHQVANLNEEKEYEFRVFAENIYGRSEPSESVRCTTKASGKAKKRASWQLDKDGNKIRSSNGNQVQDDYDRFVKDGPVLHLAADIKTCPITDNYEILERIGQGIFGEVYRVKEKATGDYYAAKFTTATSSEERALLRKEIDTINLLHHKNILRLHDAYEDQDEMVTVHELISGQEVLEKICSEPGYQMTEEQVRKYMRDICEAVRHMHDRNVIHLDLKPENLVLQSQKPLHAQHEPKVKIVDFGLACKLDPHELCKISTSAADYAAPEILNKDSVGFYTDMWAVGVLAYTLLSGQTPFSSQADIKAGQWSFDGEPVFAKVSQEGRDFIEKLLVRQKEKRMTAHECLEHPWLKEEGDEETRRARQQPLLDSSAYRRQTEAMRARYLNWWDKSVLSIGHISNYSPLRKLHADRYKTYDALLDRRELAPRFVIKPQSTFAYEGQSAKFYCMISSNSPVTVTWFKDNRELKQSVKYMKRYTTDKHFNFIVNRCKMSDFGEYVIRAENHHGGRDEPVFLDVRKRPVDFTPVHLEPMRRRREPEPAKFEEEPDCEPRFSFLLRPRIIQSGLSLKLLCCCKAKPQPTVTWLKDGKELSKRDYTMKNADGVFTLEIAACDTSHTGKYTCLAENPLGQDKTVASVLVEAKRTFTPVPMAGYLSSTTSSPWTTSGASSGFRQRSASLTRERSSSPGPVPAVKLSPSIQAADLNIGAALVAARGSPDHNLTARLYSPNFSISTNRHLRRSYKLAGAGGLPPAPATSSTTSSTSTNYTATNYISRTTSRFSRIPRSHFASRDVRRTLSTFGRSSSSLR